MKRCRRGYLFLLIAISLVLSSCQQDSVRLDLPVFLAREEYGEDLASLIKEEGIEGLDFKDDSDQISLRMTRKKYEEDLASRKKSLDLVLEDLEFGESFGLVESISYRADYGEIDLAIDREKLDQNPAYLVYIGLILGRAAYSYQVYGLEGGGVQLNFRDSFDGGKIEGLYFPDDFGPILGLEDKK